MTNIGEVQNKLTEIEAELKQIGFWQTEPLKPEQLEFQEAFGMDTMAFSQWIQFVLIPRVEAIIQNKGQFPSTSQVGAQAVREYDGVRGTSRLIELLQEFDVLFD